MTGPARRPLESIHRRRVWLKPVGSLPAGLLAKAGAQLGQARIGGREAKRPSGLAFFVRIMNIVVSRVDLDGAGERIVPIPIGVTEPPQVHLPEVEAGLAIDDPFGHRLAPPTGAGDAVGAKARCDKEPADARLTENELVVRREGFRSIDQFDN